MGTLRVHTKITVFKDYVYQERYKSVNLLAGDTNKASPAT